MESHLLKELELVQPLWKIIWQDVVYLKTAYPLIQQFYSYP